MRASGWLGAALGLAIAVAGAGCDWRDFDKLEKTTPVLALGPPSDYPAGDDFGSILLPLDPPGDHSSAGRFVATATHQNSVAVMSFDAAGQVHGTGISNDALSMLAQDPVTAIAPIPGGKQVLLGAPAEKIGSVLRMNVDPPFQTTTFQALVEGQLGVGLAAGNIGGGAAPEYVVMSSDTMHVYVDVDVAPTAEYTRMTSGAADPCPMLFSALLPARDRVNRPVIIAPLLAAGTQIAVGTPSTSGPGHVSVFDFDATTGAFTCSAVLTAAEAHFGVAMTLVDVNGDGTKDSLLVGAPPTRAYLYALPLSSNQAPTGMATDTAAGDFGGAVAAFDLDGTAGEEMFVGNQDAAIGGNANAGSVTIYTGAAMTMVAPTVIPNPLVMHEPKAGHGYGAGVAGMMFCPGNVAGPAGDGGAASADGGVAPCTRLPLVGSLSKVYAYFTLGKSDPRLK